MADSVDIPGIIESGWVRDAYIACAALAVYEHFLQFDNEVELFWKKRWTLAKFLFLCSRYSCILVQVGEAAVFLIARPSYKLCHMLFFIEYYVCSLQISVAHVILQMRVYAMYGSQRKIRNLFIIITSFEVIIFCIIGVFCLTGASAIHTNHPLPGVFICAYKDGTKGRAWMVYDSAIVILNDGMLVVLAIRKAWSYRTSVPNVTLMQELAVGSIKYFVVIFVACLASLVMFIFNRITLNHLGIPFISVFYPVFANRLLIDVRLAHYGDEFAAVPQFSLSTLQFPTTHGVGSNRIPGLSTFDERIGT